MSPKVRRPASVFCSTSHHAPKKLGGLPSRFRSWLVPLSSRTSIIGAASGVRRKRGGKPATGSGMMVRPWTSVPPASPAGRRLQWRRRQTLGDDEWTRGQFRHPPRLTFFGADGAPSPTDRGIRSASASGPSVLKRPADRAALSTGRIDDSSRITTRLPRSPPPFPGDDHLARAAAAARAFCRRPPRRIHENRHRESPLWGIEPFSSRKVMTSSARLPCRKPPRRAA
jgi:hypothetical protein